MSSAMKPTPSLLCKLGSIIVHLEESESSEGHHYDKIAMQQCLNDPEVRAWLADMRKLAMLPVKRTEPDRGAYRDDTALYKAMNKARKEE